MKSFFVSLLCVGLVSACTVDDVGTTVSDQPSVNTSFDAAQAWDEFEGLLRLHYAYLERYDFDVDAQLLRSKKLARQAATDIDFRRILHRTAYAFTDPHFIVGPFEDDDYNIIPTSSDLKVAWDNDQLVIKDVRQGSAAWYVIETGWIITHIDGDKAIDASRKPFSDVVKNLTPRQLNYGANLAVNGRRQGERQLTILTDQGAIQEVSLPSPRKFAQHVNTLPILEVRLSSLPLSRPKSSEVTSETSGKVAIIRINNQLGNNDLIEAFDKAMAKVKNSNGLILDLRNTPSGGNTEVARSIVGHFVQDTRSYQVHEIPSLEREFSVPRRFIEQVKPRSPYYSQPVVVLSGHWTGSMGEGLVIGMDAATEAHIISSNMGDLLGGLRNYNLQHSTARIDFGNETLFHVDGTPREDFEGAVFLSASDKDEQGNDPAHLLALEWLRRNSHFE